MPKSRFAGASLSRSALKVDLVEEPLLQFGGGGIAIDPKEGILLHGPFAATEPGHHPSDLSVGIIGTDAGIEGLAKWLRLARQPIAAKSDLDLLHPAFPGFSKQSPFQAETILDEDWYARLSTRDIDRIDQQPNPLARFDFAVNLVVERIQHLADRDSPPRVILVALPKVIVDKCWSVQGRTSPEEAPASAIERTIARRQRTREHERQMRLFERVEQLDSATREHLISRTSAGP